MRFGKYCVIKKLGSGGNGVVFEVSVNDEHYALKKLKHRTNQERETRFLDEICFLQNQSFDGVLPILDSHIDKEKPSNSWYIMPKAICLRDIYKGFSFDDTIKCVYSVAETLQKMHSNKVYHRDIKPDNIFLYDGKFVLSDFGLVSYPGKQTNTKSNKKVGPGNTLAPEMKYYSRDNDLGKADLYSLAKTMWIMLSKQDHAFDGKYDRNDSSIEVSRYLKNDTMCGWIHDLLEASTTNNPNERLGIDGFCKAIKDNYISKYHFLFNSRSEWNAAIQSTINTALFDYILWTDKKEMFKVFEMLSHTKEGNHVFYSWGGGNTMTGTVVQYDNDFIEIELDTMKYILSPNEIRFIPINNNPDYSFFWVSLRSFNPIDANNARSCVEDLVEINGEKNNFVSSECVDVTSVNGRFIHRIFKGELMIAGKASFWNYYGESYSAKSYCFGYESIREILLEIEKQIPNVPSDITR